jgi:hypothetical protein
MNQVYLDNMVARVTELFTRRARTCGTEFEKNEYDTFRQCLAAILGSKGWSAHNIITYMTAPIHIRMENIRLVERICNQYDPQEPKEPVVAKAQEPIIAKDPKQACRDNWLQWYADNDRFREQNDILFKQLSQKERDDISDTVSREIAAKQDGIWRQKQKETRGTVKDTPMPCVVCKKVH